MEYLNLYDNNGNLLKEKGIRGKDNVGLVGIVIIFIENSKGEFLIQKTSVSKGDTFATTGGHVSYGSTFLDTVINEVNEELGINISNEKVVEINTYIEEDYIQKIYYLRKDIDIYDVTIQESEVQYVEWINRKQIEELICNNEFRESNIKGYRDVINFISN